MAKASSPRDKGIPIENESIGKIMAKHDEMYAKELMKKKLAEQDAISKGSKDRTQKHELSKGDTKSCGAVSHSSSKESVSTLSSVNESEASKSLITLSGMGSKRK